MCSGKNKEEKKKKGKKKRLYTWLLNVMLLISGCRCKGRNKRKKQNGTAVFAYHGSKTMQFASHCRVVRAIDFTCVLSGV
jgi:hypothetical protein